MNPPELISHKIDTNINCRWASSLDSRSNSFLQRGCMRPIRDASKYSVLSSKLKQAGLARSSFRTPDNWRNHIHNLHNQEFGDAVHAGSPLTRLQVARKGNEKPINKPITAIAKPADFSWPMLPRTFKSVNEKMTHKSPEANGHKCSSFSAFLLTVRALVAGHSSRRS